MNRSEGMKFIHSFLIMAKPIKIECTIKKNKLELLDVREITTNFLECFFDVIERDSVIVELPQKSKDFCDQHYQTFEEFKNFFHDGIPYEVVIVVNEIYSKLISSAYKRTNLNIFEFYNSEIEQDFLDKLYSYCKDKYNIPLPEIFSHLLKIASFRINEEQTHFIYYSKKLFDTDIQLKNFSLTLNDKVKDFENKTETIKNDLNEHSEKTKNQIDKAEKKSMESSITILGIFSAIVLTFNAGVSFSSIVMENLISSSFYRALIITALLGLILGNTIMGLFLYLDRVRGAKTEKPETTKGKHKISIGFILVITDVFLVFTIIMTAVGWSNHWIEDRDKEVYTESSQVTTQEDSNIDIDLNGSLYIETTTSDRQEDPKKNADSTTQPTTVNNN